jgi:crotonobetainyl-CoA:carnitine CoA-transferase CaiB-like acyl-CoA transferase
VRVRSETITGDDIGPHAVLERILDTVGWNQIPARHVAFSGADPVLASRFRIGDAGAATIAACGLAAADLWELRTGQRQDVAIDIRMAAMTMRSQRYVHIVGKEPIPAWDAVSGFYQTRDARWVQLHCNFPHHRDGAMALLGCETTRDVATAAIATWRAAELEDAFAERGLCAAMVRSHDEWAALPQSRAVGQLPLMEIIRIADSDPEPLGAGERPLSGIRVLDLTRVLAGPTCARTLAEHGAEVMRVSGPHLPFSANSVLDTGHGKRNAFIDLRGDDGIATLRELVGQADVFSQAYRPGTLAARGLSPQDLAELRPGIICVSLCAYGHEGPWRNRRGFDTLVQSATGIAHEQGGDGPPCHMPVSMLDYATGFLAAFGAMTALARRAREGGSYLVRLSLCQTAHWLKNLGRLPESVSNLPDPGLDDVADLMIESQGPFGRVRHLAPAIKMSQTPPRWVHPVAPLGHHDPVWPAS